VIDVTLNADYSIHTILHSLSLAFLCDVKMNSTTQFVDDLSATAARPPQANNESSEVCGIIKPGRRVKLNRSQAVYVHTLLTIRYLPTAMVLPRDRQEMQLTIQQVMCSGFGNIICILSRCSSKSHTCGSRTTNSVFKQIKTTI